MIMVEMSTMNAAAVEARFSGAKVWLHLEGLAVLVGAVVLYAQWAYSWWLFAALLLVPDLAMLGYLANPRVGAVIYNLFHNYLVVLSFLGIAHLTQSTWLWAIGLIWLAHVGMDRMFGYGLKYADQFKHTHMDEV